MKNEDHAVQGGDTGLDPKLQKLQDLDRTVAVAADDIRGRMVKDKDGQDLGRIDGLLVDASAQKVRFMEVATGGILGLGQTKSLIPIEAITRVTADEVYISHTREHVAGAPPYDPKLVSKDSTYLSSLYPYYGYEGGEGDVAPMLVAYPLITAV
jgi:sporulation protein YlmC with PRC-barrel domain